MSGLLPTEIEYNTQRTWDETMEALLEASPGLDKALRDAIAVSNSSDYSTLTSAARHLRTAEIEVNMGKKHRIYTELVFASQLLGGLAIAPDLSKVNGYLATAASSLKHHEKYCAMARGEEDDSSDSE